MCCQLGYRMLWVQRIIQCNIRLLQSESERNEGTGNISMYD